MECWVFILFWATIQAKDDQEECSNPSFKVAQVANKMSLEQLFDISSENIPPVPASNEEKGYPLCKEHYERW